MMTYVENVSANTPVEAVLRRPRPFSGRPSPLCFPVQTEITDYKGWAKRFAKMRICNRPCIRQPADQADRRLWPVQVRHGKKRQKNRQATDTHRPLHGLPHKRPAVRSFQRQRQFRRHSRQPRLPGERPEKIQRSAGRFPVTEKRYRLPGKEKEESRQALLRPCRTSRRVRTAACLEIRNTDQRAYIRWIKHKDYIPERRCAKT